MIPRKHNLKADGSDKDNTGLEIGIQGEDGNIEEDSSWNEGGIENPNEFN